MSRARTGQDWLYAVFALMPVALVVLGMQQVVGSRDTALLLVPATLITALLTAGLGGWVGLVAVLGSAVAGLTLPSALPPTGLALAAAGASAAAWAAETLVLGRRPALAVVPPVVLLVPVLLAGLAGSDGSVVLVSGITLALAVLLLAVGSWTGGGDGPRAAATPTPRTSAVAGVAMLGVVGVALVAGTVATSLIAAPARRVDLQPTPPPAPVVSDVTDPLTVATRWQMLPSEAGRQLLTVLTPTRSIRPVWLSFDTYNGASWAIPRYYRPISGTVPASPDAVADRGTSGKAQVEVGTGLPGPWVPVPQRVTQVLGTGRITADSASGVIAAGSSPIGQRFDLRFVLTVATDAQLRAATPATSPGDPAVQLPSALPPAMAALADGVAERAGERTWDRLTTLAETLRGPRYQAAPASSLPQQGPGRTLDDLDLVVVDGVGFQEQYAAVFALTARAWGVPTRLCAGFLPRLDGAGTVVRGADTSIWAEARLDGLGWVAFQPSPTDRDLDRPAVVRPRKPAATPEPTPSPTSTAVSPTSPEQSPSPDASSSEGRDGAQGWFTPSQLLLPIIGLGLLLGRPVLVLVRRRRARSGAARGAPRDRVAGAWWWARRCLAEAGLALPPDATPDRVADPRDSASEDLPPEVAEPLRALAAVAGPALYGPEAVGEPTAAAAWQLADAVERACSAGLPARRRLQRWMGLGMPPLGRSDDPHEAATLVGTVPGRAPRDS